TSTCPAEPPTRSASRVSERSARTFCDDRIAGEDSRHDVPGPADNPHRLPGAMTLIITLASRNLFHDRVRLIATIVGIVFSIVLVTVQLGVFLSFERMVTTMIDHAQADFWIAPAETKSFEESSLLAGRERLQPLSVDGVTAAIPVVVGYASWRKPNGGASTPVLVVGSPAGSAAPRPGDVVEGRAEDLSMPDAVAVDRSYFAQLGIDRLGGTAEIANQKACVV